MTTMKAVRIHRFGGPDQLRLDDLSWPQPQDDEVVVRVKAASVNPIDYKIREGAAFVTEDKLPYVLGRDLSGTVETLGTRAHTLRPGDPILAFIGWDRGAYAEFAVVKAVEMAAPPAGLDHLHAAAIPLAGLTAWQSLFDYGGLQAGQRVLVHGAAGGVGHFAVQFAKARGATVFATASGEDRAFLAELGVEHAIDYKTQRFEDTARDLDLVLDLVGGETQRRSWAVLKRGGLLVSTVEKPSDETAASHGVRGVMVMAKPNGGQLSEIGRLIEAGRVRPHIHAVFPLAQVGAAQELLRQGHVRGKVVLDVSGQTAA